MKKKRTRKVPEYLKKRCRAARVSLRTPKTNKPRKPATLRRMCKTLCKKAVKLNAKQSDSSRKTSRRSNDAKEFARYRTQSQAEIAALKKERDMVTAQLEEQMKAAGVTDKATMDRLHAVEEELAKAIGEFQDCAKTNEAIQQRLIQSVGQYEECAEQLQRIRDEMQDIENLRADLEQELKSTRAQLKSCQSVHKGRGTGDAALRREKTDLEERVVDLEEQIKECRRAHKDRSIQASDEKQQIENLRSDLEQELKNTRAQLKDCKKAHKGRDTGDKLRADLEKRVDDLEGQIKECRRAHKDRSIQTSDEKQQIENLRSDLEQELKNTRAQLKNCQSAHKGRNTGDAALRREDKMEILKKQVSDLKSDIKECRRAHKDRSITIDEKEQIENLRADLEQELKNTRAQLKNCQSAHKGRDTGDKLRADLEKRVDDLEGQIKECRRAHKDRSGEDKEIQRQLNILDRTINQLRKQLGESVQREAICKSAYDKRGVLLEKRKATMAKMREKYHTDTQNIIARYRKHKALNKRCRTDLGECWTSAAKLKESALADYNSKVDDWKRCDMENRRLVKQLQVEKTKGRELSAKAQLREHNLRTELEHLRIQNLQEPASAKTKLRKPGPSPYAGPTKQGGATTQQILGPTKRGGGRTPEDVRRAEIIAKEAQGSLVMGFGNYDLPLFNKFFD